MPADSSAGRGKNAWLSPLGSLAMSLHMRVDLKTNLGKSPALIQTLPPVAAARMIEELLGVS